MLLSPQTSRMQRRVQLLARACAGASRRFYVPRAASLVVPACPPSASTTPLFSRSFSAAAASAVKVPGMGDSITNGTIVSWQKSESRHPPPPAAVAAAAGRRRYWTLTVPPPSRPRTPSPFHHAPRQRPAST